MIVTDTYVTKVAAQIACEYIVNHRAEGWDNRTRLAVLDAAIGSGVAEFYVDAVSEEIQRAAMLDDADSNGDPL